MVQLKGIQNKSHSNKAPTHEGASQTASSATGSRRSISNQVASRRSANRQSTSKKNASRNVAQSAKTNQQASLSCELLYDQPLELASLSLFIPGELPILESTGSSLLDSLTKDRTRETVALRSLGLVAVPSRVRPAPSQLDPKQTNHRQPQKRSGPSKPFFAPLDSTIFQTATSKAPSVSDTSVDNDERVVRDRAAQKVAYPTKNEPTKAQSPSGSAVHTSPSKQTARSADSAAARASAASVGLLDIGDTLLFGGAHKDLSSIDPYVMQIDDSKVYTLTYLLQHLSAFTVAQLENGFPNTDPRVVNRPDLPKYQTVLEDSSFQLSGLDNIDGPAVSESRSVLPNTELNITSLSDQIRQLNAKVEYLSKKLERAAAA